MRVSFIELYYKYMNSPKKYISFSKIGFVVSVILMVFVLYMLNNIAPA